MMISAMKYMESWEETLKSRTKRTLEEDARPPCVELGIIDSLAAINAGQGSGARAAHRAEALHQERGDEKVVSGWHKEAERHEDGAGVLLRHPLVLHCFLDAALGCL